METIKGNYTPAEIPPIPNEKCAICGKKYGVLETPSALGWLSWEEKFRGPDNNIFTRFRKMSISGHEKCLEESRIEPTNTKTD